MPNAQKSQVKSSRPKGPKTFSYFKVGSKEGSWTCSYFIKSRFKRIFGAKIWVQWLPSAVVYFGDCWKSQILRGERGGEYFQPGLDKQHLVVQLMAAFYGGNFTYRGRKILFTGGVKTEKRNWQYSLAVNFPYWLHWGGPDPHFQYMHGHLSPSFIILNINETK